jgi:transposase-like protein
MPKKRVLKRLPRAKKAFILREAEAKGLTAEQVEKKYGVSKWTFYGWRKNRAKSPAARGAVGYEGAVLTSVALQRELRVMLPRVLREELARALGSIFAKRAR